MGERSDALFHKSTTAGLSTSEWPIGPRNAGRFSADTDRSDCMTEIKTQELERRMKDRSSAGESLPRAALFNKPSGSTSALLVLAVMVGASLGLSLYAAASYIPNDLSRIRVILNALHDSQRPPDYVLFGDSVAMNGVDARVLRAAIPGNPHVVNASSSNQGLAESFLYYQEVPPSVRTIIQMIRVPTFFTDSPNSSGAVRTQSFSRNVFNAFYVYGYRCQERTQAVLRSAFAPELAEWCSESWAGQVFRSRWIARQWVDTSLRSLLRPDLDTARGLSDLYYPSPYTRRLDPWKFDLQLRRYLSKLSSAITLSPGQLAALLAARAEATRGHHRFVIVMAPIHPAVQAYLGPDFFRQLESSIEDGKFGPTADVIDCTRVGDAADYFDEQHPGPEGALKLSTCIAEALVRANY